MGATWPAKWLQNNDIAVTEQLQPLFDTSCVREGLNAKLSCQSIGIRRGIEAAVATAMEKSLKLFATQVRCKEAIAQVAKLFHSS